MAAVDPNLSIPWRAATPPMTVFDLIAVVAIAISVGFGIWRGVVREVLTLLSWILAFWLAKLFAAVVSSWVPASWGPQGFGHAIGFISRMLGGVGVFCLVSLFFLP